MTCDERIEALLNRAGQTISDLPRGNDNGMPYGVDTYKPLLKEASDFTRFTAPAGFEVFNVIQYAMHLTDIIDRMELALDKTLREKAYLRAKCCYQCGALEGVLNHYDGMYIHQTCDECDIEHVPDDWEEDI